MKKIFLLYFIIFLFLPIGLLGQTKKSSWQQFKHLSRPEKCWVIKHIFVAEKAWKITQKVRLQTDTIQASNLLDGDANGGQVDAFRHAFWMASLSQKINWHKAYHLGIAHEKGNFLDYKKHRLEEGSLPDKVSSDMDLWNNEVGLQLGRDYKKYSSDSLKIIIIEYIRKGKMKVIKKNKDGLFLDDKGKFIDSNSLKGKWENQKVLVNSDYKK